MAVIKVIMVLRELRYKNVEWTELVQGRVQWWISVKWWWTFWFHNSIVFFDEVNCWCFLREDSHISSGSCHSEFSVFSWSQGDLKQFLLATRGGGKDGNSSRSLGAGNKNPRPPQLSVTQIIQLASQISQGMEHLSNQRFVHCDLAARNCLIASNLTVKVSLSALCKDIYSKEYCKYHNEVCRWTNFFIFSILLL